MRYDLWIRPLDGPSRGQELRGKGVGDLVEIGKQPRQGGIAIPMRALAPVHCTVQLHEGRAIATPVGSHPIRLAPHANVDWSRIDPLREPAWWNPGGVIYLGRPGSGVALELVKVEALGAWQGQATVSPDRPVRVKPPRLPLVLVGCGGIGVTLAMGVALAVVIVAMWEPVEIQPVEGPVYYEFASPESSEILEDRFYKVSGLERAWELLQVAPSVDAAGDSRDMADRRDPENWDRKAFVHFVASAERHAGTKGFYRRVETVRQEWMSVRDALAAADLPQVLAAVPMTESRYRPRLQSSTCARGPWQLMPEMARRVGLAVEGCDILRNDGSYGSFTPEVGAPPRGAPYLKREGETYTCLLKNNSCDTDERSDLRKSTSGAIRALSEAWADPDLRGSGSAVMMTVLSHNAGLDDSLYGTSRATNLRPAYRRWKKERNPAEWHRFYGENLACPGKENMSRLDVCGDSALPAQTQHYGYTVFAQHLVAMCYLGRNYGGDFPDWYDLAVEDDGPCRRFHVPGPGEL